jgi:drug/metabolite transporter (DMT)-like permease
VRRAPAGVAWGIGAAGAATVAWGFSGILVVLASEPGLVTALERLWVGVPLIFVLLLASRRRLSWPILWRSLPGGLLLCGDIAFFFSAVKLTSIADASIIGALQPVLVLLIARPLFNERVLPADLAWTALAIGGMAVVILGSTGRVARHEVLGDLLATGALCCWTAFWVFSKLVSTRAPAPEGSSPPAVRLDSIEYTAGVLVVAAVAMVPITLLSREHLAIGTPRDWLWITLLALLPGGALLLSNWAHRFLDVSVSSVIVSVNPVVAAAAAAVVLHQSLDLSQTTGGLIAILGVVMVARRATKVKHAEEPVPT